MRGDDQQQDGMFSYISPNKRVAAGASAAADSIHRGSGFRSTVTAIQQALRTRRSAVDRSREAAAGLVAAVAVLSAKRAAADGATGLQPAVPLVCGAEHG